MTTTRPPGATGRALGGPVPGRGGLRVAGFTVRLTAGAYAFATLTVLVSALSLPVAAPGSPAGAYLLATAAVVACFLASVTAHELAHAVSARRHGAAPPELRVGFFGGAAHARSDLPTPRALWRFAAAGPAANLALAGASAAAVAVLSALGGGRLPVVAAMAVFWLNAVLAGFSLLPAAGLDGGRIAHAAAWARSGDRARGALLAARLGQITGATLVTGGLVLLAFGVLDGIWTGLLGLATIGASRSHTRHALTADALAGLRVRDVVPPGGQAPVTAPAWQTVRAFLSDDRPGRPGADPARAPVAYPLLGFDGATAGLLTVAQLAAVPPDGRDVLRLSDVATPTRDVVCASLDEQLGSVAARLAAARPAAAAALRTAGHALVLSEDGSPIAVLRPADFARARQLRSSGGRAPTR